MLYSSRSQAKKSQQKPPTLRKVLWYHHDHPDNYTDDNFLECLVINADVSHRNYGHVVWNTLLVDQQVCIVAIVASTAYHLFRGTLPASQLLLVEGFLLLTAACLQAYLALLRALSLSTSSTSTTATTPTILLRSMVYSMSRTLVLVLCTAMLSPVYATLTSSISSDTVVSCTALLLVLHLYLHDYSNNYARTMITSFSPSTLSIPVRHRHDYTTTSKVTTRTTSTKTTSTKTTIHRTPFQQPQQPQQHSVIIRKRLSITGSIGLVCAMCASILMASQLHSVIDVFALVRMYMCNIYNIHLLCYIYIYII